MDNEYVTYRRASKLTGLSEIQLHRLRIRGVVRCRSVGTFSRLPVICVEDVQKWLEATNLQPAPKV